MLCSGHCSRVNAVRPATAIRLPSCAELSVYLPDVCTPKCRQEAHRPRLCRHVVDQAYCGAACAASRARRHGCRCMRGLAVGRTFAGVGPRDLVLLCGLPARHGGSCRPPPWAGQLLEPTCAAATRPSFLPPLHSCADADIAYAVKPLWASYLAYNEQAQADGAWLEEKPTCAWWGFLWVPNQPHRAAAALATATGLRCAANQACMQPSHSEQGC